MDLVILLPEKLLVLPELSSSFRRQQESSSSAGKVNLSPEQVYSNSIKETL